MDGGAWWAAVHGVAKSRAQLRDFTFAFHFHALEKEMATHSSVLAWRTPETAELSGLPSVGSVLCLVAQSCTTLRDAMGCSPPGSSVHEISQARILECVAMPFSRRSSQPRDRLAVSLIVGRFFTV